MTRLAVLASNIVNTFCITSGLRAQTPTLDKLLEPSRRYDTATQAEWRAAGAIDAEALYSDALVRHALVNAWGARARYAEACAAYTAAAKAADEAEDACVCNRGRCRCAANTGAAWAAHAEAGRVRQAAFAAL